MWGSHTEEISSKAHSARVVLRQVPATASCPCTSVIHSLELGVLWWHCWILTASSSSQPVHPQSSIHSFSNLEGLGKAFFHWTSQALFSWIKEAAHSCLPMAKILSYAKSPYSPSLHLWCAEFISPLKDFLCCPDGITFQNTPDKIILDLYNKFLVCHLALQADILFAAAHLRLISVSWF